MDKILIIDKKENITSYDVIRTLKKELNTKKLKIGHAGTLDPFATGLLIILIGKFCKLSNYFLNENKTYTGTFIVGKQYDTADITGNIIKTSDDKLELTKNNIYKNYSYYQLPPKYSSKKINGEKAYNLARKNIDFNLKKTLVKIYDFNVFQIDENNFSFTATVSKGTYIRTLIEDFLKEKNLIGVCSSLRRIKQGKIDLELYKDKEININNLDKIIKLDSYYINDDEYIKVLNNNELKINNIDNNLVKILFDNKIIAIYEKNTKNDLYKPLFRLGE